MPDSLDFQSALSTWQKSLDALIEAKRLSAKATSLAKSSSIMAKRVWSERIVI